MDVRGRSRDALRSIERAGRRYWQQRTIARGVDVTLDAATTSCLVLAPHPDDETLGCGATIARKRAAGTAVRVVVAADGRSSHRSEVIDGNELARMRAAEVEDACAILGVGRGDLLRLGFEDGTLDRRRADLAEVITRQLDEIDPQEVRLPSRRDWHPDHRALRDALALALAGRPRPPRVLEHPVWWWMHGPWDADPGGPWAQLRPGPFVGGYLSRSAWARAELVSTDGFLGHKHRALLAHRSQTSNPTGESGWAVFDDTFLAAFLLPFEVAFPSARP